MTRWIATFAAAGIVALASPSAGPAIAASPVAQRQPSAQADEYSARRHHRQPDRVRRYPPYEPHYYARPYYYRPYPYGAPYPFVLGFGPWW